MPTVIKTGFWDKTDRISKGQLNLEFLIRKATETRVRSFTTTNSVIPNSETDDLISIMDLAEALDIANPTGTPYDGQAIVFRIRDDGTARALTFGNQYREIGTTLPTTTVIDKITYIAVVYNATDVKWDVVAVNQEA